MKVKELVDILNESDGDWEVEIKVIEDGKIYYNADIETVKESQVDNIVFIRIKTP